MKDIKAWLKLDQTKNPPEGANILEIEGEIYREISLSEYMVGFGRYVTEKCFETTYGFVIKGYDPSNRKNFTYFTIDQLLEIYLTEKGIIIK